MTQEGDKVTQCITVRFDQIEDPKPQVKDIDYIIARIDLTKEFPCQMESFKDGVRGICSCSVTPEGAMSMFSRMSGLTEEQIRAKMLIIAPGWE